MLSAVRKAVGAKSRPEGAGEEAVPDAEGDCFADCHEAHLHPDAHSEGGLAFANLELLEAQRSAVVEVIKSLGKNLLTGQLDLLKVSLPVKMFEPRSYLQKLADPWVHPRFLRLAAETEDPVARLQHVVAFFIAGFHHAFARWAKPFNPILGETWEAALPDGSRIYLEQISHHPPISAFQLQGPDGLYSFAGQSQPSVSYKTNSVKTMAKGYRVIDFRDGGRVEVHFPSYYLRGLLYTAAPRGEVTGTAEFVDAQNGLTAVVRFGRVEDGPPYCTLLQRPDALSGCIYRTLPSSPVAVVGDSGAGGVPGWQMPSPPASDKLRRGSINSLTGKMRSTLSLSLRGSKSSPAVADEAVQRIEVARCTGNWLSHLDWGEQRVWTLLEEAAEAWQPVARPLPSDCRHREDLALLAAGEVKESQRAKELLEQRQRADAKLRKQMVETAGSGGSY